MKHILITLGIVALISCQSSPRKEEAVTTTTENKIATGTEVKEIAKTVEKKIKEEIKKLNL